MKDSNHKQYHIFVEFQSLVFRYIFLDTPLSIFRILSAKL